MALYSETMMDSFRNPRNVGVLENIYRVEKVGNTKCCEILKIYSKTENDVIVGIKFETFGCCSVIASSSKAIEMTKGEPLFEALKLSNKAVAEVRICLPMYKLYCSALAEKVIKAAVQYYDEKNEIDYDRLIFPNCDSYGHYYDA